MLVDASILKAISIGFTRMVQLSAENFGKNSWGRMEEQTCGDCQWVGRCLKGKWNMLCSSQACESFEPKTKGS